jgi:hypothetical protein
MKHRVTLLPLWIRARDSSAIAPSTTATRVDNLFNNLKQGTSRGMKGIGTNHLPRDQYRAATEARETRPDQSPPPAAGTLVLESPLIGTPINRHQLAARRP